MANNKEIFELGARVDVGDLSKLTKGIDDLSDSFGDLADGLEDTGDSSEKAESGIGNFAAGSLLATGALGVLNAAVGALSAGLNASVGFWLEQDAVLNRVQAQTGLTNDEMKAFEESAENVFENNWGDDFESVAETMSKVQRITGATGDDLELLTTQALIMSDAFDVDVSQSIQAANVAATQFGIDGTDAMDMLTYGLQQSGDPADDLLDTFIEYSGNFADMGMTFDQSMRLLNTGLASGARNTDDIADATREFNIGMQEGLATNNDWRKAFLALGEDGVGVLDDIEKGYSSGSDALEYTLRSLQEIEDPITRNALGVELFGTKWEDMGSAAFENMSLAGGALEDVEGATLAAGDAMSQGFIPELQGLGRELQGAVADGLDQFEPALDALTPKITAFADDLVNKVVPNIITFGALAAANFNTFKTAAGDALTSLQDGDFAGFVSAISTAISAFPDPGPLIDKYIIDPIKTYFSTIDWVGLADGLGAAIKTSIDNIDFAEGFTAGANIVAAIITSISNALTGGEEGGGLDMTAFINGLFSFGEGGWDALTWVNTNLLTPLWTGIATGFAEADFSNLENVWVIFSETLAGLLPDWGEWVTTHLITPFTTALAGIGAMIQSTINGLIPDRVEITLPKIQVPGTPLVVGGIQWVGPLHIGGQSMGFNIADPFPGAVAPPESVGNFATGGSFTVPDGGLPMQGSTDRQFAIGLTPGENVTVTPKGGGNGAMGGNGQPMNITLELDGRALYRAMIDVDNNQARPVFS